MIVWRAWPAAILFLLAGCHRVKAPASVVHMGDAATANQLLGGFYRVEGGAGDNAWRWTGPDFSLALAPPASSRHGARLLLRLYFPETQIQKLGPMTLTAFIDGAPLAPETYAQGGSYDFVRDVPACFLDTNDTNVLPVAFSFDPYAPRSESDGRDLGAVVLMAALEAKP
jgi:hypothetical protein